MNDNGYVYVLMNPSMENMVKIGKSTRNPHERAKELSSTTGVPTPFVLVYDCFFESCTNAEKYVHTILEDKGYRVSHNREFFEIPIKDSIDAVMQAKAHFGEYKIEDTSIDNESELFTSISNDEFLDDLNFEEEKQEPGKELFDIGENHYYGWEGELQDYDEALEFYEKAIKLGYIGAYLKIGIMHKYGEAVKENKTKAFKYFKEGAKRGDSNCYAEMGDLFNEQENTENAIKSWKKYFESSTVIEVIYAASYLDFIQKNKLNFDYKDRILDKKDEILDLLNNAKENVQDDWGDDYYNKKIQFVNSRLVSDDSKDNKTKTPETKSKWSKFF